SLVDVSSDAQNRGLEASLVIDRDTASRLGITPQLIDDTLYDAFGQRQVSTMYTELNQYHVVMEVAPAFWQSPETLEDIYVRPATGAPVPLAALTPSAGVGAILALLLCRTDLSVIALIGIILLIGIVKKNAIMMIDFAVEAERTEGKPPEEAIYEACLLRFRPIMMTTMAALLGGLPL